MHNLTIVLYNDYIDTIEKLDPYLNASNVIEIVE